jgi:hypothetical protein
MICGIVMHSGSGGAATAKNRFLGGLATLQTPPAGNYVSPVR